jgi:hypothetical protein
LEQFVIETGSPYVVPRRLEQSLRPQHVRAEEAPRVEHGEAVVRLGREVDDGVDRPLAEDPLDELAVGNVALDEADPVLDVGEVAPLTGVREDVEHDDVVAGMPREPVADEIRADEAGAAGDEQSHEEAA